MTKTETPQESVLDLDDDDGIEIVEVVGLDDDSPAASVVPDDDPDEVVLSLDSPDSPDEYSEPKMGAAAEAGIEPTPDDGRPGRSDQERLLRVHADFENYKKRVERQADENRKQAAASLITRILPVLDNFERALSVGSAGENGDDNLRQGVALIFRQFVEELRREGLETFESVGQPFDPEIHDAVETTHVPDHPADTVIEELQRGYRLHGRLLRPALVKVNLTELDS